MALDAVVFPQDPFSYNGRDFYNLLAGNWSYDDFISASLDHQDQDDVVQAAAASAADASLNFLGNQTESCPYGDWSCSSPSMVPHFNGLHLSNPSPEYATNSNSCPTNLDHQDQSQHLMESSTTTTTTRPKRRRSKSRKNKEEIENQRMTHIAVERNRRKQMNEYLSVLRSLMPDSYVQRGDQASIIGGAINFVKELEQQVQFLGANKDINSSNSSSDGGLPNMPFSEFFTFPQYSSSTSSTTHSCDNSVATMVEPLVVGTDHSKSASIADIEVTMVESHANLKIRAKRRSKQLLKIVSGLHSMRLSILHLNVTTADEIALYSLSVKVEDDCKLNSVDEIAGAAYQMLATIQEEAMLN
ncbi:hypothetical protein FNV43_RR04875 [Rhamnella rubrinervis]|uniref:BHLH domain-containing protein n=1 Tax=Rhamnella rubrinervis TaxID=2594499 RepID=A0A8K0HLX8_9ROSA|nr:hypothetical protein FNV43_RR04875 [Rhamnella rubrinervis]